ncbi:mechanosensitive ion channel family protein [Nocardioides mesophilus]|uniref:Mechanosensitive ion channel n=1 Tax=Nocardioides mesophilus TaxID=433659 RepID=A0A7G9RDW6_9ACTN|nr:mechanosensitive ion channel domain-containing protein [Nocardioides mesophilus]QNN53791.1 mechanosensitive ion channel [Nocardioides mesophilus]
MVVYTWSTFFRTLGLALAGALVAVALVHVVVLLLARRWAWAQRLLRAARLPFRSFLLAVALGSVAFSVRPEQITAAPWEWVQLGCRLLMIGSGAWLLAAVLLFVEDLGLARYRTDLRDNRTARRVKTQVSIIRRLTIAAVVVVAIGAALLSFPGVEALGASVLASAGVISVVAAVAAQSTLSNLFAGLQVAFSDAIRLDDVVIVEDEWGWIEEITLSYVVVRLWDDRRMVLPTTYFTSTPFQNWTRHNSELLGAVEVDVDWRVDVPAMRRELDRILAGTELWDQRAKVLQVTDAVGGIIRVRALMTAVDAGTLFDLRCLVREELVTWLQTRDMDGLPRQRMELVEHDPSGPRAPRVQERESERPGVFSGDAAGDARAARFRRAEQERRADQRATDPGVDEETEAAAEAAAGGRAADELADDPV